MLWKLKFDKKNQKHAKNLKHEDGIDRCKDCHWKAIKRHQKCSCCRRNANLKDNYQEEEPAREAEE